MVPRMLIAMMLAVALAGCEAVGGVVATYGGDEALELFNRAQEGVEKVTDKAYGGAAFVLAGYCDKVPSAGRNEVIRPGLNEHPKAKAEDGSRKFVAAAWCPGDPPITLDESGVTVQEQPTDAGDADLVAGRSTPRTLGPAG